MMIKDHPDFPEMCVLKLRFIRDPAERQGVGRCRAIRMRQALKYLLRAQGIQNCGYAPDDATVGPLPAEVDPNNGDSR